MNTRLLKKTTFLTLFFWAFISGLPAAHAAEKPNIALVFMDNFGWGEPGFNGGRIARTLLPEEVGG